MSYEAPTTAAVSRQGGGTQSDSERSLAPNVEVRSFVVVLRTLLGCGRCDSMGGNMSEHSSPLEHAHTCSRTYTNVHTRACTRARIHTHACTHTHPHTRARAHSKRTHTSSLASVVLSTRSNDTQMHSDNLSSLPFLVQVRLPSFSLPSLFLLPSLSLPSPFLLPSSPPGSMYSLSRPHPFLLPSNSLFPWLTPTTTTFTPHSLARME